MLKERDRDATSSPPGPGSGPNPAGPTGSAGVAGAGVGAGAGECVCSGCGVRIADRYYLLAVDRQWHSSCLRCSECHAPLATEQTCFSRGGHIFCKEDYYRIFAVKRCARCQAAISSSELVMRARDLVFHLHCFTCATCGAALARGDHFGVRERVGMGHGLLGHGLGAGPGHAWQVYCRPHFEQLLAACCDAQCGDLALPLPLPLDSPCYAHGADSPGPGTLGVGGGAGAGAGMLGAGAGGGGGGAQKGRPRKRKLIPVAPVSPLGSELAHHPLTMRLSAQALEMVSKGELSSSVESLSYDGSVIPQDLSSSMESLPYECGVGAGSPGSLSMQSQQRTKRMRTSFKHHQLRTMKSYFAINQNPDAKDLKQLAQKTGLSKRVLQVWFQNARAKWRRNMMRQENGQQGGGGAGGAAGGGGAGGGSVTNPAQLGMQDASLEELHHHHAHHLTHPGAGGSGAHPPLTLADLY